MKLILLFRGVITDTLTLTLLPTPLSQRCNYNTIIYIALVVNATSVVVVVVVVVAIVVKVVIVSAINRIYLPHVIYSFLPTFEADCVSLDGLQKYATIISLVNNSLEVILY